MGPPELPDDFNMLMLSFPELSLARKLQYWVAFWLHNCAESGVFPPYQATLGEGRGGGLVHQHNGK
jgi:hypothetical protein